MLLEVKDLNVIVEVKEKTYPVLTDIDFTIEKGEVLGIVGESGSGKTVTALSIMGLLDDNFIIESGEIIFDNKDLLKLDKKERRKLLGKDIAYIFQNPMNTLNPLFNIYQQMSEMIISHNPKFSKKELKSRVINSLQEVDIKNPEENMYKYPHQFSGGQRQRILIAMAILNRPKLLIADEPTTALDVTVQYKILKLLKELCYRYDMTLIIISHNLGLIKYMSKNILVMYTGRILESGPINSVIEKSSHPYTKELLSSLPENAVKGEAIHAIKGRVPSINEEKLNCPFYPRCSIRSEECLTKKIPYMEVGQDHLAYCLKAEVNYGREENNG